MSKHHFTVEFTREYNMYDISLPSDERVTVVSDPTWDSCADSLAMLENPGKYILTPELITAAERPYSLNIDRSAIAERIEDVREISLEYPGSTILLGTPTVDSYASKMHNSLLFVRNGEITGHAHKTSPYSQAELEAFHQPAITENPARPEETVQPLVCSDLLYAVTKEQPHAAGLPHRDTIGATVKTLLASSCWITPDSLGYPGADQVPAEQYVHQMCSLLFKRYAQLETIVTCDRLAMDTFIEQPLNFVARRAS